MGGGGKVRDGGVFMNAPPHPVAGQLTHDGVAVALHVALDRAGDVGDTRRQAHLLDPLPKRLLGDAHQAARLLRDATNGYGPGRVCVEALQESAEVDREEIALVQDRLASRDPVDHLTVD